MAHTTLIRQDQCPSGRRLMLIGKLLVVNTACCGAELKLENSTGWVCRACKEIDSVALWAADVDLSSPQVQKLPQSHWAEWFKFWFELEDVTVEVTW